MFSWKLLELKGIHKSDSVGVIIDHKNMRSKISNPALERSRDHNSGRSTADYTNFFHFSKIWRKNKDLKFVLFKLSSSDQDISFRIPQIEIFTLKFLRSQNLEIKLINHYKEIVHYGKGTSIKDVRFLGWMVGQAKRDKMGQGRLVGWSKKDVRFFSQ